MASKERALQSCPVANRIVLAEGALLEEILDGTYPIWNEGLTRRAYGQWNAAQMLTPWGRDHLHRFALVDDGGRLLASAKRYRYDVRLNGRDTSMCGFGAVFTPPDRRGRGHAAEAIEQIVAREREAGAAMATLFSEIGEPFYRRLGFEPVPLEELTFEVVQKGGAPATLVRAGADRDFPDLAGMHDVRAGSARFALRRSAPMIQYAIAKKRLFSGLAAPGHRETHWFVAEEGSSAVAYVLLTVTAGHWTIEEAGDRDPAGARLGAIMQVLLAREPSLRTPAIRAWWPVDFPIPPQMRVTARAPATDVFMIRPLADDAALPAPGDVFYWKSDYF